jgi:hypothetical protein
MTDWQERVCVERQELAERMNKLAAVMAKKEFLNLHPDDTGLLSAQLNWMNHYHSVLVARISRFVKDATEENAK